MSAKVSATRDGEPSRVANLFCQVELQERETAPPTDGESAQTVEGTKVLWELLGFHIPGTIERDNGDGTYDIAWTYGGWHREPEKGKRVEKGRIHPASEEWRMISFPASSNEDAAASFEDVILRSRIVAGIINNSPPDAVSIATRRAKTVGGSGRQLWRSSSMVGSTYDARGP